MRRTRALLLIALALLAFAPAARAELGLTIDEVYLNGFTSKSISVKPGEQVQGTVTVSCSSGSFLHVHTGVWLLSWAKDNNYLHRFLNSQGGASGVAVDFDFTAPSTSGTYYILFCFDRKREYEMFAELTSRSDEEIYANGRAIRIVVDPNAAPAPSPTSRESAAPLKVGGGTLSGRAGKGAGNEYWARIATGGLSSANGEILRVTVETKDDDVDLDLEVLDQKGNRIGFTQAEAGEKEVCDVRVAANSTVYARVFAFKQNTTGRFSIKAEEVALAEAQVDPSRGRAQTGGDSFAGTGHAGTGEAAAWYAVTMNKAGPLDVELRGAEAKRDLDIYIYDDLGNLRAQSRDEGSAFERATVKNAEATTYYVAVRAYKAADESDFSLVIWQNNKRPVLTAPAMTPATTPGATVTTTAVGTGAKLPAAFEVSRGRDYVGHLHVGSEPSFNVEIGTDWGEPGKLDAIKLFAPDGTLLWSTAASGRGWEVQKITARGAGYYKLVIQHGDSVVRRGRIDVDGLGDRSIYAAVAGADPGGGGPGLDSAERETLQRLYDMMAKRNNGTISTEAAALLRKLEDYFANH